MANYGIKITKAGYDCTDVPSETTKKNFTILSTDDCLLIKTEAVISSDSEPAHGCGFAPFWDAYILSDSLSRAHPATGYWSATWNAASGSTYMYLDEVWGSDSLSYIIYYNQP